METSSTKPKLLGASITSTSEGIDRISYLPDEILHNVLSSLYIFDVVQLSILSKRWNYICRAMPYLHFDIIRFGNERVAIFRWIRVITKRNVQELVLSFRLAEPFELPYCVATCESLRVLKLQLSGDMLKLPNHLGFCQLQLLHLLEVELSNEHLMSCLFSTCPLLEKLILGDCTFGTMTVLDIASTSLVYVYIVNYANNGLSYSNCNVKISCPNLKVLKYGAPMAKDIIIENLFPIEVVHVFFFDVRNPLKEIGMLTYKMIKNVPSTSALKLCMVSVRGVYRMAHEVRNSPVMFYKLKSLKLTVGIDEACMQAMILLLKHSPNLEVLNLFSDENFGWDENWKLHDPSESIVCLKSHLKMIQLTGFKYEENEMELLRFFLKNARVLEKLIIVWADFADISKKASEVVLEYPKTSSHTVVTFLDVNPKPKRFYRHNII
ncbi:FBD-associated F-box protein At5g60610 [Nicotiana tabacum]|uniref:FBD-associated F-box protein At5g60610 n=1 Tax=Nicotiana tabacum TaxID=4097 RepID=A0AC58S3V8_TOBAC